MYKITRKSSEIKNKEEIFKLSRNNFQFYKQILLKQRDKANLSQNYLFNNHKFHRTMRFTVGAPNPRKTNNYALFQTQQKNKENRFKEKKSQFWRRGLRAKDKLEMKVLSSIHGKKNIWGMQNKHKKQRKSIYEIPRPAWEN